ncbi:hypothetical protein [Glycomyces albidus]|uniref:DUF4190 domain-containing protein n=1 Tax=Glycomyces albidus TaxID=2656774 RepID=A0A6L5G484_9ACTN|nr:hypothetical protein [Glycomyces albidus]MQM24438.1 hypothetical protein [Glycomyces albidus]
MTDPFTDLPIAPQGDRPPQNGLGNASLAFGLVALATTWLPALLGLIGLITGVLAVVFGAIGLAWARTGLATNRGTAAGGLFSGLGALTVMVLIFLIASSGGPFGA